jgi:hypothetical protein
MTRTIKTAMVCAVASTVACAGEKDPGASGSGPQEESGSADDDDSDDDSGKDDNSTDPSATAEGSETGNDDGEDSESGDDGSFIQNPDGGGTANECDLWAQDCPSGEKCMPWSNDGSGSWNATKCVELVANPGQPGDTCTVQGNGTSGLDDCDETSMCWNIDDTNTGVCQPFCSGSEANPVCSDNSTTCVINNGGAIILCLPICDPLLTNDCPEGDGCYPTPTEDAFICVFDANGPDDGAYGDSCMFANVCNPGLHCADASFVPDCATPACCTSYCDLTEPDASESCPGAAGGQECIPWFPENAAPPGFDDLGACQIPT